MIKKLNRCGWLAGFFFSFAAQAVPLALSDAPTKGDFLLAGKEMPPVLVIGANEARAVSRAVNDLALDFERVTGAKAAISNTFPTNRTGVVLIGTIGRSKIIDQLAAAGKIATNGIAGAWESYVLQVVNDPVPGVARALVIAGSDPRGTIYGAYQLSEMIGVSPWYWWVDVPAKQVKTLALRGDLLRQGPPAVKYRGIFLNDEDWGLRPWASKTFDPQTGNIGPKTYAKIFELLLRLRANHLWPAMHPGTAAFNSFPEDATLADDYGIVMGSSHCEQMLRNNIGEWDEQAGGDYNFVTNPDGVLKYWERRVAANGKFENIYTLGMRGIHDSGMPGGGTEREKAVRLQNIIAAQRAMLARNVNSNVTTVPQIFCPYKEVLPLYRLMTNLPDDITLVWPDDNFGYIRQFSDARERQRSGGAGVYYHVSYYGAPRDYLWLCSTPPALIAEEMTKAFDHGANRVWVLNVGDIKPAELDMEFFLKLAWNPHSWNGTNTYALLQTQLARDFGSAAAPEFVSILAEYYRLNFLRKPENAALSANGLFTAAEAAAQVKQWRALAASAAAAEQKLPPGKRDAFFELIGYPVRAAAANNEKYLAGSPAAAEEITRLTRRYNEQVAGGKWRGMMDANPRGQVALKQPEKFPADGATPPNAFTFNSTNDGRWFSREAENATRLVAGQTAGWRKISGLGYNGTAIGVFPTLATIGDTPDKIRDSAPRLEYQVRLGEAGDWTVSVRTLPTFSLVTGRPPRYAVAFDDAPPQIVALPASLSERDRVWQENVLRNAAITSTVHRMTRPGIHTLKVWAVDPGVVFDAIIGHCEALRPLGYTWPPETPVEP